jgi:redox-sensitive bicupin YhaK (pirin superfamily)
MGVQLWVALPEAHRATPPGFEQHRGLPKIDLPGGHATVILGRLGDAVSPARSFSPLVAAELSGGGGPRLVLPVEPAFEHALLPLDGGFALEGQPLELHTLYYLGCGRRELPLASEGGKARALLIGGAPFGETVLMWWNFVARTTEEIVAARADWQAGRRFAEVSAYAGPRLEAPPFVARPVPRV